MALLQDYLLFIIDYLQKNFVNLSSIHCVCVCLYQTGSYALLHTRHTHRLKSKYYLYSQCVRIKVILTLSPNHCCSGKAISITYSEWVSVGLFIQHAMRMRPIILSSVALSGCTIFFPHYVTKGTIFGGKNFIDQQICVLIFSTNFTRIIAHYKNTWARYCH